MAAAEDKCQIYDFHIPKVLLKVCSYYVPNLALVFYETYYIPESIDADSSSCDLGKQAKQAARARMTVYCDLGRVSEARG